MVDQRQGGPPRWEDVRITHIVISRCFDEHSRERWQPWNQAGMDEGGARPGPSARARDGAWSFEASAYRPPPITIHRAHSWVFFPVPVGWYPTFYHIFLPQFFTHNLFQSCILLAQLHSNTCEQLMTTEEATKLAQLYSLHTLFPSEEGRR